MTKVPGPVSGIEMSSAYVEMVGRFAYVWGWPMVSMINRRTALTSVSEPGLRGGALPNAPMGHVCMLTDYIPAEQRFVACTNQDVLYGFGFGALNDGPIVIQLPDYGDRFWVTAVWNHRTDSIVQLGKQYGTTPGFYLVVGPNWDGQPPAGIAAVFRSPTELVAFCPRVFVIDTDEDRAAVTPLINQTMIYPLSEFDGTVQTTDWQAVPNFPAPEGLSEGEVHWVDPEKFFDQLPQVLETIPPLPGEEAIYATISSVLDAAAADPAIKQTLTDVAVTAERDLISPLLQWRLNGPPAGNGWYSPTNNSAFGTDYLSRAAIARSNMFENAAHETKYVFTDTDASSEPLNGTSTYTVTFAAGQQPPVNGFWSVTLYNEHHFYNVNPLGRYSLGTKSPNLQTNSDGSLTIYAGAASPVPTKRATGCPHPKDRSPCTSAATGPSPSCSTAPGRRRPSPKSLPSSVGRQPFFDERLVVPRLRLVALKASPTRPLCTRRGGRRVSVIGSKRCRVAAGERCSAAVTQCSSEPVPALHSDWLRVTNAVCRQLRSDAVASEIRA